MTKRIIRSLKIAQKLEQMSISLGLGEEITKKLYILGYVHDIGYKFSKRELDAPRVSGSMLKEAKYEYWREVFHRGDPYTDYNSIELKLLNIADLLTDDNGENITIEEKLNRTRTKHGVKSDKYKNQEKLALKVGLIKELGLIY